MYTFTKVHTQGINEADKHQTLEGEGYIPLFELVPRTKRNARWVRGEGGGGWRWKKKKRGKKMGSK